MQNILIPYDFSDTAENALNYAISLFENEPINFTLLNVYISNKSTLLNEEYNEEWFSEMDNESEENMRSIVSQCNLKTDHHIFKGIVKANSFIDALKETIRKEKIDLILTGTQGAHTFSEVFIGTNTLKIIRYTENIPILAVPYNYTYVPLHQIVFSTNFNRPFKTVELKPMIHLGFKKNSLLEVVFLSDETYLSDRQKENKKQIEQILDGFEVDFKKIEWIGSETATIESHVENSKSELLVLINHRQNFFNRLTQENVIKKVTFHSKVPLLILPEIV